MNSRCSGTSVTRGFTPWAAVRLRSCVTSLPGTCSAPTAPPRSDGSLTEGPPVSIPVNSQESAALAALVRARWAGGFATTIYVDGQFAPAHGRERLEVVNPANARTIATIAAGDQHDVSLAVEAARAARTAPRMAGSTGADRAVWLSLADLIEDEADQLARLLTAENGLTLVSSRTSVTKSAGAYRYFAGLAETLVSE